jgi:hypothetical protein
VEFFEHLNLFEKIIVAHVTDSSKNYLPFEYQSNTIYEDYRIELLSRVNSLNNNESTLNINTSWPSRTGSFLGSQSEIKFSIFATPTSVVT